MLVGRDWQDIGQLFFIGLVVGMIMLVGTQGVNASVKNLEIANSSVSGEACLPITPLQGWHRDFD
ncbi:hypothetical protein WA1_49925 [Scytonema hofmannii PCC 7110]|uniref:Uncharacterized protein n=1 Tax=Scytonema hofmannii PCC 7110 TaxID=128403 RepID=A0A139WQZ0_9CYAN|nr:hypothetical protein [Scytonema hofmannii]KYC34851.1 hypothetical protein WA1_49925 [Scytonema hofmannii PCC 7110]